MPSIRSLSSLFPLLLLTLALAACGASSSSSSSTTPATTTTTGSGSTGSGASFANYTACLEQHGVTAFAGRGGAGGAPPAGGGGNRPQLSAADRKKFQAAQTACAKYRPAGGRGFPGGANSAAFAAYSNCLKLHGVTLARGTQLSTASKKVKTAMAACAPLRPAGAPKPPSSSAN
jgi:hypothetical protein